MLVVSPGVGSTYLIDWLLVFELVVVDILVEVLQGVLPEAARVEAALHHWVEFLSHCLIRLAPFDNSAKIEQRLMPSSTLQSQGILSSRGGLACVVVVTCVALLVCHTCAIIDIPSVNESHPPQPALYRCRLISGCAPLLWHLLLRAETVEPVIGHEGHGDTLLWVALRRLCPHTSAEFLLYVSDTGIRRHAKLNNTFDVRDIHTHAEGYRCNGNSTEPGAVGACKVLEDDVLISLTNVRIVRRMNFDA